MESEESSKRVKLTECASSADIAELEQMIKNQKKRKRAIQKERDAATGELQMLRLTAKIQEIERSIAEYRVDIHQARIDACDPSKLAELDAQGHKCKDDLVTARGTLAISRRELFRLENDVMDINNQEIYKGLCDEVECYRSALTNVVPGSGSSSGSPPRFVSPRQIQLGGIETETMPTTRPQISTKAELPAWLMTLTRANAIQIAVEFNEDADLITLPNDFLAGSGSELSSGGPIVLYKRPACRQQIEFISKEVIQGGKIGNIYGQPGTGKSITTYFTLASHSSTHRIVWVSCEELLRIAFNEDTLVPVVVMQNGLKANYLVGYKDLTRDIPKLADSAGHTILALDSASLSTERIRALVAAAHNFAEANRETNTKRLIYVSSWGTRADICRLPLRKRRNHAMAFVHGWKLDDYKTAMGNNSFARAVAQYLDLAPSETGWSAEIRSQQIESKFYFAGHCARYMLAMSIDEVKEEIEAAVSQVSNYRDVFNKLVGTSSDIAVHRILSRIDNPRVGNSGVDFVSHYALWKLSERHGLDSLLALVKTGFGRNDDGFLGCVYELIFFLTINTSIPFKPKDDKWPIGYVEFDPDRFDNTIPTNIWLKSSNPRQSGCDAVVLIPGKDQNPGIVRFVQITRAKVHPLKLQAFADLAQRVKAVFKNNSAWLNFQVEIFFLIPSYKKQAFKITPVESKTVLYRFGWPSNPDKIVEKVQFIYTDFD